MNDLLKVQIRYFRINIFFPKNSSSIMIAYEVKVSVFKYFFRHENIQFAFEANSIKFEMPTHFSSSVFFFSFSCIGLIYTKQHSTFWSNVHYRQPFSSLRKRVFFLCRHILQGMRFEYYSSHEASFVFVHFCVQLL